MSSAVCGSTTFPGDTLGSLNNFKPGLGTYGTSDNLIKASMLGKVTIENVEDGKSTINVIPPFTIAKSLIIEVGDTVVGRIVKINYNQAFVDILAVGDLQLQINTKGIIRREDVRSTEIDKVVVQDFFSVGDVVRAGVISLGDNKQYYLSTADKNSGVLKSLDVPN